MNNVTNLNKFKKQKAKVAKEAISANNRILFGTPKHLKSKAKKENSIVQNILEAKKIMPNKNNENENP